MLTLGEPSEHNIPLAGAASLRAVFICIGAKSARRAFASRHSRRGIESPSEHLAAKPTSLLVSSSPALYASVVLAAPKQASTEQELYDAALRALMRRAHSIHQMKEYLGRRTTDADLVGATIARLRENRYLDDSRYAAEFARQRAQSRRQGRFRIARELRARGVLDQHIESALDSVFAETDESALVRARLKRRLALLRGPLDQRKMASLYRSLLGAGFSAEIIRTELRNATRGDLPDLADPGAAEDA